MTRNPIQRSVSPGLRTRAAFFALLLAGGAAQAVVSATGSYPALADADFLEGMARLSITRSDGSFGCSGSLLAGGTAVLTAAHCVSGNTGAATASSISMSWQGGTVTASAASYVVAPGWSGSLSAGNDLAIVLLSAPVTAVQGYQLADGSVDGASILLAGYGLSGNGTQGASAGSFGTLRYGFNQYDASQQFYTDVGFQASRIAFFDFDNGQGAKNVFGSAGFVQFESMIAPGDSGGASFVLDEATDTWLLAGVHSFGACVLLSCTVDSKFGTLGGDVVVFRHTAWIEQVTSPVPEPQVWGLLLAGLGLVGWRGRRAQR
jgi:secreted trypsin-like serine protease